MHRNVHVIFFFKRAKGRNKLIVNIVTCVGTMQLLHVSNHIKISQQSHEVDIIIISQER